VKWLFVTRARMDRELAAVREAARQQAEQEAARYARQLAEAAAANKRLDDRRRELGRRLDSAHDENLVELADITALEARANRADDLAAQLRASERRTDRLQARLDDSCGLNSAAIEARRITQARPVKEESS
jgi:septal ring factor EnvC (AmiA/AmiB activator)